jgi:hypothetical protein
MVVNIMENVKRGYKKKTIEKVIRNKLLHWIRSIKEPVSKDKMEVKEHGALTEFQERIKNNVIVTGGAIASMLMGDEPNDYDLYFTDINVACEVAEYYVNNFVKSKTDNPKISKLNVEKSPSNDRVRIFIKSAGVYSDDIDMSSYDYFESLSASDINNFFKTNKKEPALYSIAFMTDNAISLHGDIQLIFRFVGNPDEIHRNYDFVHTTNYYTFEDGLVLRQEALESIMAKELKYVGSLYPICSVFRIRKFITRGWTINAGEIFKICWDISKLDLTDYAVLQEQLVGVDAAYFNEILSVLNQDQNRDLDRTYLFELVNRVFESDDLEYDSNEKE